MSYSLIGFLTSILSVISEFNMILNERKIEHVIFVTLKVLYKCSCVCKLANNETKRKYVKRFQCFESFLKK